MASDCGTKGPPRYREGRIGAIALPRACAPLCDPPVGRGSRTTGPLPSQTSMATMRAMASRAALPAKARAVSSVALPAKARLHGYEIEALVSHGSLALVYRAYDHATRQVVAIKEYFPEALALRHPAHRVTPRGAIGSERFEIGLSAFVDEARSLARFEHASLVRVLGLFEANGTVYRVMRFTPGPTLLAHRTALGRAPAVEDFRRWVDGLLGALATLHRAGCMHGAVSPGNILLRPGEQPLLLGYDTVRTVLERCDGFGGGPAIEPARAAGERRGTPGAPEVGAATDLRALASTLSFCVEGDAPDGASLAEAWGREGGRVPVPPDLAGLFRVIEACRSEDPRQRPRTLADFSPKGDAAADVEALRGVTAGSAGDAARPGPALGAGLGVPSATGSALHAASGRNAGESRGTDSDPPADALSLQRDERAPCNGAGAEAGDGADEAADNAGAVAVPAPAPIVRHMVCPPTLPGSMAVTTIDAAAPARAAWRRRTAAGVAVAASVGFAVAASVWGYRRSGPPAESVPTAQAAATLRVLSSGHAAEAPPQPAPGSPLAVRVEPQAPAGAPGLAAAVPDLAPERRLASPPAADAPPAPRRVAAAPRRTKSPLQACDGRKGFALYQCMQVQCAKPASSDHADCVSLR